MLWRKISKENGDAGGQGRRLLFLGFFYKTVLYMYLSFNFYLLIFGCTGFPLLCKGLSLVAAIRGYSLVMLGGLFSCGTWALEREL